jgi:hypothetical protein
MPIGILEVDATPSVMVINFVGFGLRGISPVGELLVANSTEDFIEF